MKQVYLAPPASRQNLREAAFNLRKTLGLENQLYFPVVEFLEFAMPQLIPDFEYEILPVEQMGNKHGETQPDNRKIALRADIYERAVNGEGRDRFTVAHEIKHCLFDDSERVKLYRVAPDYVIKRYVDPEWQADAFAGELLIPYHLMRGLSIDEIVRKCGVTKSAAQTQLRVIERSQAIA
jgi:Zn-dependent peptidase ImmA (M78 family)